MANIVYHYTSPEGIYSILKNKTLWFTDCQYLNDKNESLYIREPFIEAHRKLCGQRGEPTDDIGTFADYICRPSAYENYDWDMLVKGKIRIGFPPAYRHYVLCTSYNPDTASMWNYYVKNGAYQGYNLGINIKVINSCFARIQEVKLISGKVIYDRKKQINIIYNRMKELSDVFDSRISSLDNQPEMKDSIIDAYQNDLTDFINEQRLFFKHPAFKGEEEYRFVLKVYNEFFDVDCNGIDNITSHFRVGSSGIITPYIEWKYPDDMKAELLKQITLSPTIEEDLAIESFNRFLREDVRRSITIVPSSIKLRF